jgi:hypothetical protein
MRSDMDKGDKYGPMEPATRACGSLIRQTAKEHFGMCTVIGMKAIGLMTKLRAMESTRMRTEQNTTVSGRMTCRMAGELRSGLTGVNLKVIIKRAANTDKEAICGPTEAATLANGWKTK